MKSANGTNSASTDAADFTLRQALHSSAFWFITAATAIRVIVLSAVNVHYVALMVWTGMSQQRAAVFLAIQAFMALPSHLLFGWFGDKVNKPKLMAACMLLGAGGVDSVGERGQHPNGRSCFSPPLFSAVESTFPVNWSTVGEYFGRKNFAKIRGSMSFVSSWGSVIGPVLAGVVYDRTQSYEILIWSSAALLLVASLLYAMVRKPSGVRGEA